MQVYRFNNNVVRANMYVIMHNEHYILIDPSVTEGVQINGVVDYILLTHEHYDHICCVNHWKKLTKAKIVASVACQKGLQNPTRNFSRFYKDFCQLQTTMEIIGEVENNDYVCSADLLFEKEYEFEWEGQDIRLFETPGHSKGSICILINGKILFCGDTLFKNFPIATGLPGGSKSDWETITKKKLANLKKDIIVYPGHYDWFILKDYQYWNK